MKQKTILYLITGVMAFVSIFFWMDLAQRNRQTDQEIDRLQSEIDMTLAQIDSLKNAAPADTEEMVSLFETMEEKAKAVADLQNKFHGLTFADNKAQIDEIEDELQPYFDPNNEVPGWYPWFKKAKEGISNKWSYVNNTAMMNPTMNCIWVCEDEDQNLFAYARAVYNPQTGLFEDMQFQTTDYGMAVFDETDSVLKEYLDEMINQIEEAGDRYDQEVSHEEQ